MTDGSTTTTALPGVGDSIPAPRARHSADGRTTTAGTHTLSVDTVKALDPNGATLTITGQGYDPLKGIYVAFCVEPKRDQPPSPCGGGADTTGATGASQWVSSNPPPYGRGLAVPYGADGSFTATLHVTAPINTNLDCREVQCVVATRNDHTRSTDRSQDVFVPVAFQGSRIVEVDATPAAATASSGSGGGSGGLIAIGLVAVIVVAAAVAIGLRRRSRRAAATETAPSAPSP